MLSISDVWPWIIVSHGLNALAATKGRLRLGLQEAGTKLAIHISAECIVKLLYLS